MTLPRLIIASQFAQDITKASSGEFDIVRLDELPDVAAWLVQHGGGIEVVIATGMDIVDQLLLDGLPDLKLIAVVGAGLENIDLAAAKNRNIAITNAGAANSPDVADLAVGMMLTHRREILQGDAHVRSDKWMEARMPRGRSVSDERIGIVGMGYIGKAISKRLGAFDAELAWWGPRPKEDATTRRIDSLLELAKWATTLIVSARADQSSHHLIDTTIMDALGSDGLLINVSRGFVVDENAMKEALKDGRLGGAALDVFENEPFRGSGWPDVPNVLFSPHRAGGTQRSIDGMGAAALENARRLCAGREVQFRVA